MAGRLGKNRKQDYREQKEKGEEKRKKKRRASIFWRKRSQEEQTIILGHSVFFCDATMTREMLYYFIILRLSMCKCLSIFQFIF
jgi:hypothetical protein